MGKSRRLALRSDAFASDSKIGRRDCAGSQASRPGGRDDSDGDFYEWV
jgi:hypothetical protein